MSPTRVKTPKIEARGKIWRLAEMHKALWSQIRRGRCIKIWQELNLSLHTPNFYHNFCNNHSDITNLFSINFANKYITLVMLNKIVCPTFSLRVKNSQMGIDEASVECCWLRLATLKKMPEINKTFANFTLNPMAIEAAADVAEEELN